MAKALGERCPLIAPCLAPRPTWPPRFPAGRSSPRRSASSTHRGPAPPRRARGDGTRRLVPEPRGPGRPRPARGVAAKIDVGGRSGRRPRAADRGPSPPRPRQSTRRRSRSVVSTAGAWCQRGLNTEPRFAVAPPLGPRVRREIDDAVFARWPAALNPEPGRMDGAPSSRSTISIPARPRRILDGPPVRLESRSGLGDRGKEHPVLRGPAGAARAVPEALGAQLRHLDRMADRPRWAATRSTWRDEEVNLDVRESVEERRAAPWALEFRVDRGSRVRHHTLERMVAVVDVPVGEPSVRYRATAGPGRHLDRGASTSGISTVGGNRVRRDATTSARVPLA